MATLGEDGALILEIAADIPPRPRAKGLVSRRAPAMNDWAPDGDLSRRQNLPKNDRCSNAGPAGASRNLCSLIRATRHSPNGNSFRTERLREFKVYLLQSLPENSGVQKTFSYRPCLAA